MHMLKNNIFRYKRPKRRFTQAVSESPVWPHVSNHIFLYKCMRNPDCLTVYRPRKCAVIQLYSRPINTTLI